jgi:hypothetical protein
MNLTARHRLLKNRRDILAAANLEPFKDKKTGPVWPILLSQT